MDGNVAQNQVRSVYRELDKDNAIKGVGATLVPDTRPNQETIVPKEHFPVRIGLPDKVEEIERRRTRVSRERVSLISPVLIPGPRRWRFSFHEGEFGAPIKDSIFVEDLLSGKVIIPMTGNIEMDVDLQRVEEQQHGVWVVQEWAVLHVEKVYPPVSQTNLFFPWERMNTNGDKN